MSSKASDYNERNERERSAPRLAEIVPSLSTLKLHIAEHSAICRTAYRKHVVVQSASSLFLISCGDERCQDGGHDLTHAVMHALRAQLTDLKGEHECQGVVGPASPCGRRIEYHMFACYRAPVATR